MADIITFRPSPQDKVALGRIMHEHPYLNKNVSAAIRVALNSYHELQNLRGEQHVRYLCESLAQDVASGYQQALRIRNGDAAGDAKRFMDWLSGFEHRSPDGFAEAMVQDRAPIARSESVSGDVLATWYFLSNLVIGRVQGAAQAWYVIPFARREEKPLVEDYQEILRR